MQHKVLPQQVTEGDPVLYVLPDGRSKGEERPAFVVKCWDGIASYPIGTCNLQVLTDGPNDELNPVMWATSVLHDHGKEPGTWHFPE